MNVDEDDYFKRLNGLLSLSNMRIVLDFSWICWVIVLLVFVRLLIFSSWMFEHFVAFSNFSVKTSSAFSSRWAKKKINNYNCVLFVFWGGALHRGHPLTMLFQNQLVLNPSPVFCLFTKRNQTFIDPPPPLLQVLT